MGNKWVEIKKSKLARSWELEISLIIVFPKDDNVSPFTRDEKRNTYKINLQPLSRLRSSWSGINSLFL